MPTTPVSPAGPVPPDRAQLSEMMFPQGGQAPGWPARSPERELSTNIDGAFAHVLVMRGDAKFALRFVNGRVEVVMKIAATMTCDVGYPRYSWTKEIPLSGGLDLSFIKDFSGRIEVRWGWGARTFSRPFKALDGNELDFTETESFDRSEAPSDLSKHEFGTSPWFVNSNVYSAWWFHEGPAPKQLPFACALLRPQTFEIEWFKA